jgi:hypothetical protein
MRGKFFLVAAIGILAGIASGPARGADPATGFRGEYLAEVDSVGKKLLDLANTMPSDKYGWRPSPGVRTVSEVYVHVAGGNYMIPSFMGVKPPEGINREMEKTITEKAKVVDVLKKSIENVKTMAAGMSDADLAKKVKAFGGREMSERQLMLIISTTCTSTSGSRSRTRVPNGVTRRGPRRGAREEVLGSLPSPPHRWGGVVRSGKSGDPLIPRPLRRGGRGP